MLLKKWDNLPSNLRINDIKPYYDIVKKRWISLILKRIFDITFSLILLVLLLPIIIVLSILIKIDSPGPIFFRQVRVTQYGKEFRIHKFRTMKFANDGKGLQLTRENDVRVTRIGSYIRKYRLDEVAQLIDILLGDMTFVGVRPEVPQYVSQYKPVWNATLLLPAGLTSNTSIIFKDEISFINSYSDIEEAYIQHLLPQKMNKNLEDLCNFSVINDIFIIFKTIFYVFF